MDGEWILSCLRFSCLRNPCVMRGPHQLQIRVFTFCSYTSFDSLIFLPHSNNKQGKCVAAQAAPLQLSTNSTHTSTTSTNGNLGVLLSAQRPRDASQIDSDFERSLHEKNIVVSDKVFNGTLKRGQAVKDCQSEQREKAKKKKNREINSSGDTVRAVLDLCSKMGDFMGAIKLYEVAKKEGIQMNQYHFGVLLYLCSSAATGIVKPAKSGNQSLKPVEKIEYAAVFPVEKKGSGVHGCVDTEIYPDTLDGLIQHIKARSAGETSGEIQVNEDMKRIAIEKGLEIYNEMLLVNIPMNEALYTAAARMAMAIGDGYLAFEIVRKMKTCGIEPRLRSYSPALATFCSSGDVLNAFKVESHMLENGVKPEEPELRALLKVSIEARKSDKVYYILHKLRESVRRVSPSTAELIEGWFCSKLASRVGKRKCDPELIVESRSNGGGWHGKGWLGKGKWSVCRSCVISDGFCNACGEKLVSIDLDPAETEKFADSVAAIASKKERNSSFQKFQKWLEYYGPFEAVVDAANVGLNNHRKFRPSKVHAVVNGIRQMLPSRKWPLLVLHHKRITGGKMDQPFNKSLIEKWRNADAIYATPSGSNDDWYWLYAAIKMKCLIVTNDEMRDHLFQLLGDDFFPKWKERHQVHFSFDDTGPVFHMPPPYSVDIQESAQGHWHIPIASEHEKEDERIWLCITRPDASKENHPKKIKLQRFDLTSSSEKLSKSAVCSPVPRSAMEGCYSSILPQLLAAESIGAYTPDFQI